MLKAFAAAVIVIQAAACASLRTPAVRVDVEEVPASDRWRITIRHSQPAGAFVFPQTRQPFRAAKWTIIEPRTGANWATIDGFDALVFDRPARKVVLDLHSDFSFVEKDYRLNVPFTEGSRLLYTGHIRSRAKQSSSLPPHEFTFRTSSDRPIRILDRAGTGRLAWTSEDETYVYFGSIPPETTPRMTLIVDPGLPEWIEAQMRRMIPRQFDYFAANLGSELPFGPLIVVSYGGSRGSGRTFSGGGLQAFLELGISGEQWMPQTPEAEREWVRHLSHEIFHLWGAQANPHGDEAEWLSEASAEYASVLAAVDAGVFDEPITQRFLVNAANACIERLAATPLRTSLGPGQSRNVYTCGVVSQKIVDAAARAAGSDIWAVWRRTYASPRPYTTADHVQAVGAIGNASVADFIEELSIRGLSGDAAERFGERLRAAGMKVSVVDARLRLD